SKLKLKELVDACHARNIKVIIDVVPNHVGDYIQGTGSDAHYVDYNSSMKTGTQVIPAAPFNDISWYHNNGDIDWTQEYPHTSSSTAMLEDHDLGGLDDIDFDNSSAKSTMINSIKYWFDYTGADAARVDAAKCMKPSDIHDLQTQLGVTTFGENFDMDVSFISDWVGDNAENGMLDFPLFQSIVNDFAYGQNFDDTSTGTLSVKNVFDQDSYYGDHVNEMVTFIDNHDRNRFLTEAGGNVDKMQNALTFIFTCRGVPVVFQGTEQNKGNANGQIISGIADTWNRWSMVEKDANGNVICDYFNQNTNTYKLIADLNNLRSENQALQTGTQREMWASPSFYAFSRRVDSGENMGQEVICAFSNSNNSQQITMPLRAESSLAVGTVLTNA
ncbi:MAG: alpha-amylase family glycosyl hydrolase, partial [Candidatus Pelagibacter ubique]